MSQSQVLQKLERDAEIGRAVTDLIEKLKSKYRVKRRPSLMLTGKAVPRKVKRAAKKVVKRAAKKVVKKTEATSAPVPPPA